MREGLMDDVGYHGFDDAEEMFEKYCGRCVHLPLETNEKGELWAGDCDKCSAKMEYFEEAEEDALYEQLQRYKTEFEELKCK